MDFWRKMLSGIADSVRQNELSDDVLLSQIEEALREEKALWSSNNSFIDPCKIKTFQDRWYTAYCSAKKKTGSILFSIGLKGHVGKSASEFIETYEQLSSRLQSHNDTVARKKTADVAKLILPVEGNSLDGQQLLCISKEVRNHLVLAGAGTGKTTTIVGYVKYLLKRKVCMPEDILVLSFTNASAAEMSERLNKEIGRPIAAQTFHKLGLNIITTVEGKKPQIFSMDIRQFVRKQLDVLTQDADYLKRLCIYLTYNGTQRQSEFDFQTEYEYQSYLKYNPPITLKKETVKSYGELDIANFLTQNGISYVYEQEYPIDTRTSEYGQYRPDFYLPNFDIYIEYFGVNRNGEVPPYFSGKNGKSATQTYQDGIAWKRKLHKEHGTRLIEVYAYERQEEQLLPNLEQRLKKAGVVLSPMSAQEMWDGLNGTENQKLDRVAELFGTVINLTKNNNCTLEDIRMRNHSLLDMPSIYSVLSLIEPIYNNYQAMLHSRGEIDFNDMINLATEYVQAGKYVHPYSYVIVDEYQDISQSRFRLLDTMRQQRNYNLFCVGDDWQSIYRFNGSDIGFILHFEKYWGAAEISRIETTYRFPQSLIDVSGDFIMQNPEQNKKKLRSAVAERGFSVEKITGYTNEYAVIFLAERLKDLPKESTVLFLGRYRFDIKMFDGNRFFSYKYNAAAGRTEVIFSKRSDLHISFMTVHGSKGLQADYVFLLNNKAYGMGFPSQIADAPILQLLLDNCDHYPFAEERRLFYVAITRAKKKVFLVTLKDNESVFVDELDEVYGDTMRKEQYTCPLCGGHLVRRSGPYGDFYGCSNYKTTGCNYIRKIAQKKAHQNTER